MNRLPGEIKNIETSDRLSMVEVALAKTTIWCMIIDTPSTNSLLQVGQMLWVVFKESDVAISQKVEEGLSISNRLKAKIRSIKKGKLLSRIVLDYAGHTISAIIPNRSVDQLHLELGTYIYVLVRINEILLMNNMDHED